MPYRRRIDQLRRKRDTVLAKIIKLDGEIRSILGRPEQPGDVKRVLKKAA